MQRFEDEKEDDSFRNDDQNNQDAFQNNNQNHQNPDLKRSSEPDLLDQIPNLRRIKIDGKYKDGQKSERFPGNSISNQKYSTWNFVPVVLFNQFKFFFNLFFLCVSISQFFESLRVGFLFTFLAPLVFVLLLTMAKEGYDDYQRYQRDKIMNTKVYKKIDKNSKLTIEVQSKDLKVGDVIYVQSNERVPADLVLLYTTDKSGTVFIRTDQLDGETDWKVRRPVTFTQNQIERPEEILFMDNAEIKCEGPTNLIYEFAGLFENHVRNGHESREALSLENTLWAETVLASQGFIVGIVVYTGRSTRSQMNQKLPTTKQCQLDREINYLSKILFVLVLILSMSIVLLNGFHGDWLMFYFRIVLLLSSIIPISLRVNLDLAKMWYSYCINQDDQIPGTVARNSTIPEELGRIQFLITDKTGTLTQNDMICKRIMTEFAQFSSDDTAEDLKELIFKNCRLFGEGPCGDYDIITAKVQTRRREQHQICRDMLTALTICNNVTPVHQDPAVQVPQAHKNADISNFGSSRRASNNTPQHSQDRINQDKSDEPILQASSPDEIALVKFAIDMNMYLLERDRAQVQIKNSDNKYENYEVLANFPFSSETKKMSILVRQKDTGRIIYYVKGAEVVMETKVKPAQRAPLLEFCESLAMEGLRTLVIAQKVLTAHDCELFLQNYKAAASRLKQREQFIQAAVSELEHDLEFLGVTGVEDKLQNNVQLTIESLKSAGIQVWMLTGDKVETATSIAISAGLKSRRHQLYFMRELDDPKLVQDHLKEFAPKVLTTVLIIDGKTLDTILKNNDTEQAFFEISIKAPCVCVCRCSPTQKARICQLLKLYTNGMRIAGVGDGGNDVGMILEADVGIGIVGKEGMQASLASDFSIMEFGSLRKLILWHGRLSYKRSAVLSQFVIHRGLIISVIQGIFIILFYFVAIPVYNGFLMLGYATIYTSLPVFSLVFDRDANVDAVLKFPPLYKTLQKGRNLNFKTFCIWVWKSLFQVIFKLYNVVVGISNYHVLYIVLQ
ncbi:probable phospholipid-transporting atpase iib-like [Stylonychia lemnae]|uniref:Phospholipid-transporting ATPase n=1 Tax=Stylonychia lemnae TaxID=5949 RepID=A0A078AD33_STYLE|nr:probable phospholipid-transporting atpase iib-like [Stylonychia lemnae]|eukprot:CDW80139.1 probable phospholipid-transporting atpase iib-like [Stylonychia lemnae]